MNYVQFSTCGPLSLRRLLRRSLCFIIQINLIHNLIQFLNAVKPCSRPIGYEPDFSHDSAGSRITNSMAAGKMVKSDILLQKKKNSIECFARISFAPVLFCKTVSEFITIDSLFIRYVFSIDGADQFAGIRKENTPIVFIRLSITLLASDSQAIVSSTDVWGLQFVYRATSGSVVHAAKASAANSSLRGRR